MEEQLKKLEKIKKDLEKLISLKEEVKDGFKKIENILIDFSNTPSVKQEIKPLINSYLNNMNYSKELSKNSGEDIKDIYS